MPHSLTIWTNVQLPPAGLAILRRGADGHRLVMPGDSGIPVPAAGAPDPDFLLADVAFGQPHPQDLLQSTRLKWTHLSSAGYTRYDTPAVRNHVASRGMIFTNSSGVFNEPCAQHVLAMMLSFARDLPAALDNQRGDKSWPYQLLRSNSFLLNGQTALLVGYGAIGRRLAELLAPFHMNLLGFRRSPTGAEPIPVHPLTDLDRHLSDADHVIDLLPDADSTRRFFDASRFAKMKPGVRFYNIGRGATVDHEHLSNALAANDVASAYLDVTDPEPLPKDHPNWTAPNLYITPHTAGGHAGEFERVVEHFLTNLEKFTRGEKLIDQIM